MTQTITLRRPDDWHLHLRDGAMMEGVLPHSAAHFARAIVMPNLVPPVVTGDDAAAYRERILAALPEGADFEPLMTLYLTETTDPEDVRAAAESGLVKAVKLYPAGATTNSSLGVRDFDKVRGVLEAMAEIGLPLCVHGEVTRPEIDIFDREAAFIDEVLDPLRQATPGLRVVMEHITTSDAADYASGAGVDLTATITVQHLMLDRNDMLVGGIRPHYYCLPILKRGTNRTRLIKAATSGDPSSFWAQTVHHMRQIPKKRLAGARGASQRRSRFLVWLRSLMKLARWTNWKVSPPCTGLRSMGCRKMKRGLPWSGVTRSRYKMRLRPEPGR